ncbi:MAG: TIGR00282 family metallophosphoesterase [Alphaproteobacteria bacterium]
MSADRAAATGEGAAPTRLLFLGDVVGRVARRAIRARLRAVRKEMDVHFVVANGENASGGHGIDPDSTEELLDSGVDVVTTGNHVWKFPAIVDVLERDSRLLRPRNFPDGNPGRGWTVQEARDGARIGVLNLIGRAFMGPADCPFRSADEVLAEARSQVDAVFVDMHAETTSEKSAMGWYLAGRVAAVVGSHTHVQTADERVLPGGTAFLTDAGMCGPVDSVIGMRREEVLRRFLSQRPERFEVARGPVVLQGAVVEIDRGSGRAASIRRWREDWEG